MQEENFQPFPLSVQGPFLRPYCKQRARMETGQKKMEASHRTERSIGMESILPIELENLSL